jgi:hypothetical protein
MKRLGTGIWSVLLFVLAAGTMASPANAQNAYNGDSGLLFATRAQLEACYPQIPEFFRLKSKYDPEERLQSDWCRHYRYAFWGS